MRLNQRNAVTPLLRVAVELQSKLFQILWPAPYGVRFTSENYFSVYFDNVTSRYIPWCFVVFGVIFGFGWTSCVFIVILQLVFKRPPSPWVQWSFISTVIVMLLCIAGTFAMLVLGAIKTCPEVMRIIIHFQELEQKCKFKFEPFCVKPNYDG